VELKFQNNFLPYQGFELTYQMLHYCIVLYLYIYIALLTEHTNQKRLQCERPKEKRAVFRKRKEARYWYSWCPHRNPGCS